MGRLPLQRNLRRIAEQQLVELELEFAGGVFMAGVGMRNEKWET